MNDSMIISAISAIHRAMVSFFIFILVLCSLFYFTLKDGYLLYHLDLPGLEVEQLYIKWDEKLSIHIKGLYVTPQGAETAPVAFSEERYFEVFKTFATLRHFIDAFNIDTFHIGDAKGTLQLHCHRPGKFHLTSKTATIDATLACNANRIVVDVTSLQAHAQNIEANATVVADLDAKRIYATVTPHFKQVEQLKAYLVADHNTLRFALRADKPLTNVKPIVDLFGLPHDTTQWILDKPKSNGLLLHELHGTIPYHDPSAILQTLQAKASLEQLSYQFNPNLEPVHSLRTDLELSKGVLNIYPKEATFYGQSLGDSWLNIDFNARKTLLNGFIIGDLVLNEDIVHLLETYRINLPFKQTEGNTTTDLDLHVELIGGHTDAEGTFNIQKGQVDYRGVELDVKNASIALSNADITISKLNLTYGSSIIDVDVQGRLNPAKDEGDLNLALNHARMGTRKSNLQLAQQQPLKIDYTMTPGDDTISVAPSHWQLNEHNITIGATTIPYDFTTSAATLDHVDFDIQNIGTLAASGIIDLIKQQADLQIDLKQLDAEGIRNLDPVSLHLKYNENLDLNLSTPSRWDVDGTTLLLSPMHLDINETHTRLDPLQVQVNDEANATGELLLDHATMSADVHIDTLEYLHRKLGLHYRAPRPIHALAHIQDDAFYLASDAPDVAFTLTQDRWDLFLFSFEQLAPDAPLLERFALTEGYLQIGRARGDKTLVFAGNVELPYAILVKDNTPTTHYEILGSYENNMTRLKLNETLDVVINDAVHVTADHAGFNVLELIRYINERPPAPSDDNASFPLTTLYATDGYIYISPTRKALLDQLSVTVDQGKIYGRMTHKKGVAVLEMQNRKFALYGTGFGDQFMRHLLSLADYHEGELSFHIDGVPDDARGVMHIKNTVVKDYKALNNILAFINTVPALATFSLPKYSDKGLEVKTAYTNFHYDGKIVTVDGVSVDADEIDIAGNGIIDYVKERVDLKLNLITDAGENVSKIPLLGYILVGDRGNVTATLRIKGPLDNPKVSSDIAENIVVAPFKMIWRTIELPFKLFEGKKKKEDE